MKNHEKNKAQKPAGMIPLCCSAALTVFTMKHSRVERPVSQATLPIVVEPYIEGEAKNRI